MNVVSIVRSTTRWCELQLALFRKFCGVELIFINNGPNHDAMQADLDALGAQYRRIEPSNENNPSLSHSLALRRVCREFLKETDEPLCIVDQDIFPTHPVDLAEVLGDNDAAGQKVCYGEYWSLWPGLLLFSRDAPCRAQIQLGACLMHDEAMLDSGGELWFWLDKHKPRVRFLPDLPFSAGLLPDHLRPRYREAFVFEVKGSGAFFHLHGATNWFGMPAALDAERCSLAEDYLKGLL